MIALRWLSLELVLAGASWSAEAPPKILGVSSEIVAPGTILTLAGGHLAGAVPCTAPPSGTNPAIYPTQLCGVQVFFGDEPAGLLYVSTGQINFQVSKDAPRDGNADLRVVYDGQSSSPYTMKAGFDKVTIRLAQPAYTDMPVWLKVEFRSGSSPIQYPSLLNPAGFGCSDVEVRRDGKPLAKLPGSSWNRVQMNFSGFPCGTYVATPTESYNHLPLHLLYRFDEPGVYEARLTYRNPTFEVDASEWTPIEVQPPNRFLRSQWLDNVRARHPMDPAELLTDVLPNLLGLPDEESLAILTSYLDHPDERVRRFAGNGLYYWPEASRPRSAP